jgi:hypothetical protein
MTTTSSKARRALRRLPLRLRSVLCQRLAGKAFSDIAAGEGCTRQRAEQLERQAIGELARAAGKWTADVTVNLVLQSARDGWRLDDAGEGRAVLRLTPELGVRAVRDGEYLARNRHTHVEDCLDDLATEFLAAAERGRLTAQRRASFERQANRLAGRT